MTPAELAERGLRVKPLKWSAPLQPCEACRYDHVQTAGADFYRVEWKSWKPHDSYTVFRLADGGGEVYVTDEPTLEAAKAAAEADYASRIAAQLEGMG